MTTHMGEMEQVIPEFTIGDRLRKARERARLSQLDLARELEVSRNTIANYEAENVAPHRRTLRDWSAATGVPLEWLLTGEAMGRRPDGPDGGVAVKYPRRDLNPRQDAYMDRVWSTEAPLLSAA